MTGSFRMTGDLLDDNVAVILSETKNLMSHLSTIMQPPFFYMPGMSVDEG
jgi:hypothetical protein